MNNDRFNLRRRNEDGTPSCEINLRNRKASANSVWAGDAEVVAYYATYGTYNVKMLTGRCAGVDGDFLLSEVEPVIDIAPAAPVAAPLKIESGKYYRTRDGRKVGPMGRNVGGLPNYPWQDDRDITLCWTEDGHFWIDHSESNHDLVSLWEEPAVAVAASNDNAAPTKPKFKVGDVVRGVINPIEYVILKVHADGKVDVRAKSSWCNYFEQRAEDFAPLAPAIVCLIENGQPKPADRPFVHPDQAAAERESRRLAGAHKGKEFGVYVLTSTAKEERTYDHEWQRLAVVGRKIEAIKELRSEHTFLSLRSAKDFVEDFLRAA